MPSRNYYDEIIRTYEYNFWLYQYISRKFKIEVEYECDFDKDGKIELIKSIQTPNPGSRAKLIDSALNLILDRVKSTFPAPDPDMAWEDIYASDRDIIQELICAWHDCEIKIGFRNDNGFYPLATHPGAVWAFLQLPPEVRELIWSLHNLSLEYGFYAYALPHAQKSTCIFNAAPNSPPLSELNTKNGYAAYFKDWSRTYLETHKDKYFFKHDFMPNYRDMDQPGHSQITTRSKGVLSYIWPMRNFKYTLSDPNDHHYFTDMFIKYLDYCFARIKQDSDHQYIIIWFLLDEKIDSIDVEKTLTTIDRIIESIKQATQKERLLLKPIGIDGKQIELFSGDERKQLSHFFKAELTKQTSSPQIAVAIKITHPDYAENTTKNKVKEIYLKAIEHIAPKLISKSPKAEGILLQSTYCHETFRSSRIKLNSKDGKGEEKSKTAIRMAALMIWDALYFDMDSFQHKTKGELDKIASELISGKKYIDTNNRIIDLTVKQRAEGRGKAFIDFGPYANGGHLTVAFKQTCLSIARGEVLPMAIRKKS